jgi:hypothetical protein
LFDLNADPKEQHDIASKHPDIVKQMASQHAAWATTLAPLGEIPKIRAGKPIIPSGHGWAFDSTKDKGDTE